MAMDPGSNLVSKSVKQLNEQFDVSQKVSMVDVHTSSGVENGGVQQIKRHLTALCSDFRAQDSWSEPKYLMWCCLMMNNLHNSEVDDIPLRLHWGDMDSLATKYLDPVPKDKQALTQYIEDLWKAQRIANDASSRYQQQLHEQRIAKTPVEKQNVYQPGDFVLKLRKEPIHQRSLQRFKYTGPYIVESQKDNFVNVRHATSNEPRVFPVDRLVIFDNSRDEAKKVALLDQNEFFVSEVLGYKGNPLRRSEMQFLVLYEDEDAPIWVSYDVLLNNKPFEDFVDSVPCLHVLKMSAADALRFFRQERTAINEVQLGDKVYMNIRYVTDDYDSTAYDLLNLPDAYTKQYVVLGEYTRFSDKQAQISIYFPTLNITTTLTRPLVLWYGVTKDFDPTTMVLVDDAFLQQHPQLYEGKFAKQKKASSSKPKPPTKTYFVKQRLVQLPDGTNHVYQYSGPYTIISTTNNNSTCQHVFNGRQETIDSNLLRSIPTKDSVLFDSPQLPTSTNLNLLFLGYDGDPMDRDNLSFYVTFSSSNPSPEWIDFNADLLYQPSFKTFISRFKCFDVIKYTSDEANIHRLSLDRSPITSVKLGDTVYIDLRAFCTNSNFLWYRNLNLPSSNSKTYVFKATVSKFFKQNSIVEVTSSLYQPTKLTHSTLLWYTHQHFSNPDMIEVTTDFTKIYPQVL